MRRHLVAFGVLLLCRMCFMPHLSAQEEHTVFNSLRMPVSAVVMGLGGQSSSFVGDDVSLLYASPALFGQESCNNLSMGYSYGLNKSHAAHALYALPISDRGALGLGMRYIGNLNLKGYDVFGASNGTFSVKDMAFTTAFSYDLSDYFRAGISLNMLYSAIESYSAFGLSTDVGISYFDEESGISVGAAFKNIGALIKGFNGDHEMLYGDFVDGISKHFGQGPLTIHLTAYDLNPKTVKAPAEGRSSMKQILRHLLMGAELHFGRSLWFTLGFSPKVNQDLYVEGGSKLGGFSLGGGLDFPSFKVGVGVARYHSSATSFLTTFSTNFGRI